IKSEQKRSPRIVVVTPAKYREQADQAAEKQSNFAQTPTAKERMRHWDGLTGGCPCRNRISSAKTPTRRRRVRPSRLPKQGCAAKIRQQWGLWPRWRQRQSHC